MKEIIILGGLYIHRAREYMSELCDELLKNGIEIKKFNLRMSNRCIETEHVRIYIIAETQYPTALRGRRFDELFGFGIGSIRYYRKADCGVPFTGTPLEYILMVEKGEKE